MSIQTNARSNHFPQFKQLAIAALSGHLFFIPLRTTAFAQSTNRDAPTSLTSSNLSGRGVEGQDRVYYYKFTAKPGKMSITLDVNADNTNGNSVRAEINLQTPDGDEIQSLASFATQGERGHTVKKLKFAVETPIVLVLNLTGGSTAGYNYRVKINGDYRP